MKRVKQLKVELLETDLITCQLYTAINQVSLLASGLVYFCGRSIKKTFFRLLIIKSLLYI